MKYSDTRKTSAKKITLTQVVSKLVPEEKKKVTSMDASEVKADMLSLSKAGTMQLRKIARTIHVKHYSKLKRQELIFAIIAKKEEFIKGSQLELFK